VQVVAAVCHRVLSVDNTLRLGAVASNDEPAGKVTEKLVLPTSIDSIVEVAPETLTVMLFTERTVSTASETSSAAAKARPGRSSPATKLKFSNFFMSVRYELVISSPLADSPEVDRVNSSSYTKRLTMVENMQLNHVGSCG